MWPLRCSPAPMRRHTVNLQLGPQRRRKPLFLLFTWLRVATGLDGACHAWQHLQTQLSELCSCPSAVRCVMSFTRPPSETGSLAPSPQQAGVQVEWQLHAGSLTWFPCLDTDLWGLTTFCGRLVLLCKIFSHLHGFCPLDASIAFSC